LFFGSFSEVRVSVMPEAPQGDVFEAELVRLIPNLRAFAHSLCAAQADAEDLTQETIAKALNSRASFSPGTNMRSWLFAILHNRFRTDRRHAWRASALDPDIAASTLRAIDNPDAIVTLKEVRDAMASLSMEHQEVLVLVAGAGLTYEEAVEILGISMGTLKSRLSRARTALQAAIDRRAHQGNGKLRKA
jgi:RNA polymerase sigma-70 factor, ECF subfamily